MQGNPKTDQTGEGYAALEGSAVEYAIRLTFGVVHASLLTLFSFGLAFLFPSFSHFLFSLFGCILAPLLSFFLAVFCNACVEYVSKSTVTWKRVLKWSWIPPLGVFGVSLLILPLEMIASPLAGRSATVRREDLMMPSHGFKGPVNTLVVTSIIMNFIATVLLQIYAAKKIQSSSSSDSETSSGPT